MKRSMRVVLVTVLALAVPAAAYAGWSDVRGHATVGYAKLFIDGAPGGSISATGGIDHPLWEDFRIGADVGYHLLGSRNETRGSLFASVDYSVFEAALLVHWTPRGIPPLGRVSFGPALMSLRAELSTAGGGAAFSDLAVEEVVPGVALDATFMSTRPSPVRVGLELGTRIGFRSNIGFVDTSGSGNILEAAPIADVWTLATARLAFHY